MANVTEDELCTSLKSENLISMENSLPHLRTFEAESIYIMREVAAELSRPVMLYSIGKDSSVMLRLV